MSVQAFVTGLQHIGIPTNDMEKTLLFYKSLGFEEVHAVDNQGEQVVFLRLKDLVIETYQNGKASLQNGAIEHIALDVTDIERVYAEVSNLGYHELEEGIQFLPFWNHGVRFFTIQGPNSEKVEFSQML